MYKGKITMDNYSVKAYKFIDGKEELQVWAAGFSHKHAKNYFECLYKSDEYSSIRMARTTD